jgi:hypothetical protein
LVGAVGIISIIPGLTEMMTAVFGLSQIIWFVWLGIVLLRSTANAEAQQPAAFVSLERTPGAEGGIR